jgi:hypothetical protein
MRSDSLQVDLDSSVSIVVLATGLADALPLCLRSVMSSTDGEGELLIIHDKAPSGQFIKKMYSEFKITRKEIRMQLIEEEIHPVIKQGMALRLAKGEYIFVIGQNTLVTPSYFQLMLDAGTSGYADILFGSSNVVVNGTALHHQQLDRKIRSLIDLYAATEELAARLGNQVCPQAYRAGDSFMTTRRLLDQIGGYDAEYERYLADYDFSLRATQAGFSHALVPAAFTAYNASNLDHSTTANRTQADLEAEAERVFSRDWAYFKQKHGLPPLMPFTGVNCIPWNDYSCLR